MVNGFHTDNLVNHLLIVAVYVFNKIIGVETVDHPSDEQLVVYARKYFVAADRMRP